MAGIDFKALKNARKAIEDKVEDNVPEELESTYTNVWGGNKEKVMYIEVTRLVPFTDSEGNTQPYKLNEQKVAQIKASAEDIGIVEPLRVRKKDDIYEVLSGHHRLEAAKELGQLSVPCIVGDYDDETAYKVLSECNIQRDKILPSEYGKIFSRYMKLREENEDLTVEEIAKKFNVSRKTIYRYTTLNTFIDELQELVDSGVVNIHAVECLKDLGNDEQKALAEVLTAEKIKLTVPLAKKIKKAADEQTLDHDEIISVLTEKENTPSYVYKNKVYSSVSSKFSIKMSESELDELTERLLEEYFSAKSENN